MGGGRESTEGRQEGIVGFHLGRGIDLVFVPV